MITCRARTDPSRGADAVLAPVGRQAVLEHERAVAGDGGGELGDEVGGLELPLAGKAKRGADRVGKLGLAHQLHRQAGAFGGRALVLELLGAVLGGRIDPAVGGLEVAVEAVPLRQVGDEVDAGAVGVGISARRLRPVVLFDALQIGGVLRGDLGRRAAGDAEARSARLDHRDALAAVLEQAGGDDADDAAADDRDVGVDVAA